METSIYIGLDVGSTAVKAIAFNTDGQLIAVKRGQYPTFSPQPGFVEQDPGQIFQITDRTLRALIRACKFPIAGIGMSAAMHSLLAVDKAGEPLTPAMLWSDNRSAAEAAKLRKTKLGKQLYESTGTPIHAMSPLCKLTWWYKNNPGIFRSASRWVSLKEYILYRLTGEWVVDYSMASATGLFDIRGLDWCKEALDYAKIRPEQLSTPVATQTVLSFNQKQRTTIPLVIGASDGCLANWGAGSIGTDEAVMTVGTSSALRSNASAPVVHPGGRMFCYLLSYNRYVFGGGSNAGGNTWQWLNKTLLGNTPINYQKSFDLAAQASAGSEGLLFLPYLLGERAPLWNTSAQAAFSGLTQRHERKHLLRAGLEGILFNLRLIAEAMQEMPAPAFSQIAMSGGMASSPFFMQLAADIMGARVYLSHTEELSAWGAALIARQALTGETAFSIQKPLRINYPNEREAAIYNERFEHFKLLLKKYKYL